MEAGFVRAASGAPTGLVIATRGAVAEVSTSRRGACAGCADAASCGVSAHEERFDVLAVRNSVGARPGDTVELDLPPHVALQLSFLVWVLPLTGLLAGAALGAILGGQLGLDQDGGAFLGAIGGTGLMVLALRRLDRRATGNRRLTPFITRVLRREGCRDLARGRFEEGVLG